MFCRIGDFYELFYEDAILVVAGAATDADGARPGEEAADVRGSVSCGGEYICSKLLRMGYKVALCEQMEDPKLTKTIVRREVTRVLTPGTAVDPTLGAEQSNYLASVCVSGRGAERI